MIQGTHFLFYSTDPEADRAFFRDILSFPHVDAGEGWLIFKLPPAEAGIHPVEGKPKRRHAGHPLMDGVLYLMCDDLRATLVELRRKKVRCSPVTQAPWGKVTSLRLPSGGQIGLYEPRHPTALKLRART